MKCPKCNQEYLLLIVGTYGHLLEKENQYYICTKCGQKFKREEIENEDK
jgi:transposase-like protein